MSTDIEVIAIGARTPVGLTAENCAAAVRAGIPNHTEFPFIGINGEPVIVACDPLLKPETEGPERLVAIIESSVNEVMQTLTQSSGYNADYRVLLALPESRPGFSDNDAESVVNSIQSRFQPNGTNVQVEIAGRGHAGSIRAVELAMQQGNSNRNCIFLVIGADSYHHTDTFLWLESNLQFAQENVRGGFIPGEGAGCIALTNTDLRKKLNLPPLAQVQGAATAQENSLRDSEVGSFGVGMTQAVLSATKILQLPNEGVDTLYTDINGERYRSEEWGFVAMRTPSLWKSLEYEAPSDCWGDVGAAFGVLAGVLAIQSYIRDYARGPRTLITAGSESGLRGAMLLQAHQEQ